MSHQTIELQHAGATATVWLNRPDLRNAFNETAIAELTDVFGKLAGDGSVRAVVLAGRGPAFCAGADLNWMRKMAAYTHAENVEDATRLAALFETIYRCPKPVVARVHGDCYAGGVGLAAAADIVLASAGANFCLSEVKLGLIPATISPYVVKAMGEAAARRYFLTAEPFSAWEAHRIGLVHEVAAADVLDSRLAELTEALCAAGPHAVAQAKRLVQDVAAAPLNQALIADTVERIAAVRGSAEGKEGVQAFLDKRKPNWRK